VAHDNGPDDWPSAHDEAANEPPRRRASDGGRVWFGRPLTLAFGWVLSCVLITAVTFTAVEHVGREVSGTQDLLSAHGPQPKASSTPAPSRPVSSPAVVSAITTAPVDTSPASAPIQSPRSTRSTKAPTAPVSAPPTAAITPPPPTPPPFVVPANAIEYVFTCQNGKAVGGAVQPSPSASGSKSPSPSGSPSATPTSSPSASATPSASPSVTPTPTSSPSTSKSLIDVPGGTILIACSGNVIANAKASTPVGSNYTLSVRSITAQTVDVFFAKN
jgi:hypothetical protein